jgi:putative RNA 2'-phosphotransferase
MEESELANPLVNLSKLLSLMLRHEPQKFGLVLDGEGFVSIPEVIEAARSRIPSVTRADIVAVVETIEPDKCRFSIVDDEIRANYGHSVAERIAHDPQAPPEVLFHGTTEAAAPLILREGLRPMKRQYVHMTPDLHLALRVGARRGKATILNVAALTAHAEGVVFYRANESFWLADSIPAKFLSR